MLIFIFKASTKRHILAWDRVVWHILRDDQFGNIGCMFAEEPKNGIIFYPYG